MRLIDADALMEILEKLQRNADKYIPVERGIWIGFNYALTEIKGSPTVDAVPVVRCKNCKFYSRCTDHQGICTNRYMDGFIFPDWYCADGERRE